MGITATTQSWKMVTEELRLIQALRVKRDWSGALAAIRALADQHPTDPAIRYSLGLELLAQGDFAEGFALYEERRRVGRDQVIAPPLTYPEWDREPVDSLLVWCDQGFGDAIMFARYIPRLFDYAKRLTIVCRPELERLFSQLGAQTIPFRSQMSVPRHTAWSFIGSLPHKLRVTLRDLDGAAYLSAPARSIGAKVGVAWKGRPTHVNDRNRSFLQNPLPLPSLQPEDTGAHDFQDTAEIISGLDLVISVDTSIAHLAGAIGKPVWILLPYLNTDWRWLRERQDSPWYDSALLFRQPALGDWTSVLADVQLRLGSLAPLPKPE